MTVFVDTSAWYALLARADANHARARERFSRLAAAAEPLVTHNYVVVETLALVGHRLGMDAVRRFCVDLLPVSDVEWILPATHDLALAAYLESARGLSFVDHVSFTLMRARAITSVFAFDEDFTGHGFQLV